MLCYMAYAYTSRDRYGKHGNEIVSRYWSFVSMTSCQASTSTVVSQESLEIGNGLDGSRWAIGIATAT